MGIYSVSKESINTKVNENLKLQWQKDEATLKLFKQNIEHYNLRVNYILIHLIDELSIKLQDNNIENREQLHYLDILKKDLENPAKKYLSLGSDILTKIQDTTECKPIVALLNNRNNFCYIYEKVLHYIKEGSKSPGSITFNNIYAVIVAYSKVTAAQSIWDMVSNYPLAIKDIRDFLNKIEDRSKSMADFVSKSPKQHRYYEILNEMNTKMLWYDMYNGMTKIYGDIFSKEYISEVFVDGTGLSSFLKEQLDQAPGLSRLTQNKNQGAWLGYQGSFSEQEINKFLKEIIHKTIDSKKLFNLELAEKEFLLKVIELVDLNPDIKVELFRPYVAKIAKEDNLYSGLVTRYLENELGSFIASVREKRIDHLKASIIDNLSKGEQLVFFIRGFYKTELEFLEDKIQIVLNQTDPKLVGLDSDDYAYNYFLQDKAPWLPNHVNNAKSVLITKRLERHHELLALKNMLKDIRKHAKDEIINLKSNTQDKKELATKLQNIKVKITKIEELYKKVIKREKDSLNNLYKDELEGIQYILSKDLANCSGLEVEVSLCANLLKDIENNNLTSNQLCRLKCSNTLGFFISELEFKMNQAKGLIISDPNINKLKAIHNSLKNLKSYLDNNFDVRVAQELYDDIPLESLPYGRYIHEKNQERRKKNWEEQESKLFESLQQHFQNHTDYLLKVDKAMYSTNATTDSLKLATEKGRKILSEIKDQETVSIESINNEISHLEGDKLHLMLMYSAGKMQLFANKLFDVLKVAKENPDVSGASQPIAFLVKYGQHKLVNNPFGMLYDFYLSYQMDKYSKFLTDFSNQEPNEYRIYEILNYHSSISALKIFNHKMSKIYPEIASKEAILKLLADANIGQIAVDLIKQNNIKELLNRLNVIPLFGIIESKIVAQIVAIANVPLEGKYGEKTDPQKMQDFLLKMIGDEIDKSNIFNPNHFNEEKIINHVIELQDLAKRTNKIVPNEIIKQILGRYNPDYIDANKDEYNFFDEVFENRIIDDIALKDEFIYKLSDINKVASLLDNKRIIKILNVLNSKDFNFQNIADIRLRDIDNDIPGETISEKREYLINLLQRRANILITNTKNANPINPETRAFNYFAQENIALMSFQDTNIVSTDLSKRLKKHVEFIEFISDINDILESNNSNLSDAQLKALNDTKNNLEKSKDYFLAQSLFDEFLGVNQIFAKIDDTELNDLKQESIDIERDLNSYINDKGENNLNLIIDKIVSFEQNQRLNQIKLKHEINFIQNSKISSILLSLDVIYTYLNKYKTLDVNKDTTKNLHEILDNSSTIEKNDFKIMFSSYESFKEKVYDLFKSLVKVFSPIFYQVYNFIINKIFIPLMDFIVKKLNYPFVVGHYDSTSEGQAYLENNEHLVFIGTEEDDDILDINDFDYEVAVQDESAERPSQQQKFLSLFKSFKIGECHDSICGRKDLRGDLKKATNIVYSKCQEVAKKYMPTKR